MICTWKRTEFHHDSTIPRPPSPPRLGGQGSNLGGVEMAGAAPRTTSSRHGPPAPV